MSVAGSAQIASFRRDPIIPWPTVLFVTLLHLGAWCLLMAALPTQPARMEVGGGDAGEDGGGGMGFRFNGGGLGTPRPAQALPEIHPSGMANAFLQGAMANRVTSMQQLEVSVASVPDPAPTDPRQMLGPSDAGSQIGLPASNTPGQSLHLLHGGPMFPGPGDASARADATGGQPAAGAAKAAAAKVGTQITDAQGPRGTGDGGGAVGNPGARGSPGVRGASSNGAKPDYPAESNRLGEEGIVIVSIEVLSDGRPGEIEVVKSSGYWRLDEAAVDFCKRAHHSPAVVDGQAVTSKHRVEFDFHFDRESDN